jgi:hypothetical protein
LKLLGAIFVLALGDGVDAVDISIGWEVDLFDYNWHDAWVRLVRPDVGWEQSLV